MPRRITEEEVIALEQENEYLKELIRGKFKDFDLKLRDVVVIEVDDRLERIENGVEALGSKLSRDIIQNQDLDASLFTLSNRVDLIDKLGVYRIDDLITFFYSMSNDDIERLVECLVSVEIIRKITEKVKRNANT